MIKKIYRVKNNRANFSTQKIEKLAKKVANKVVKKAEEEEFVTGNFVSSAPVAGTPVIIRHTGTAQGDAVGNRTGNQVNCFSISNRIRVSAGTSQSQIQYLRFITFKDIQQQGTAVTGAQLIQDWAGDSTDVFKHINRITSSLQRFKILSDKIVKITALNLNETAAGAFTLRGETDSIDKYVRIHKTWKNGTKVQYIGTTNAQASDGYGHMYTMVIATATSNGPLIDTNNEMRFRE